jgi:hypothetical protein
VIYLLGGSFVDDLAFKLLAIPIFYPIVVKLGYDPISPTGKIEKKVTGKYSKVKERLGEEDRMGP